MVHWQWLEPPLQTARVLRAHHISSLKQRRGAQLSHQKTGVYLCSKESILLENLQCEAVFYCQSIWSERNQTKSDEAKGFLNQFVTRSPLRQVQIVSTSWINVDLLQNYCSPVLDVGKSSGLWLAKSLIGTGKQWPFLHFSWCLEIEEQGGW